MNNKDLFNKLDKIIKANGGYVDSRYPQLIIDNKIKNFKTSIDAFLRLANREEPSAPLQNSEYALAETYKKGLDQLFDNNKKLAITEISEKIIVVLKESIEHIPIGLGRRLLWDTTSDFIQDNGIEDNIVLPSKKKTKNNVYKYIDLNSDNPGSGLNDKQISKIIDPLLHIIQLDDIELALGDYSDEFQKQVMCLTKGLSGRNLLKDDVLLNARLNLLIKWFNFHKKKFSINNSKATDILNKIEIAIKDGENFLNNNLFKKYKHCNLSAKKNFNKLIGNKPQRFIKNLTDIKKKSCATRDKKEE